jgi:glycosyltransferase involved in cell wall biosynthesis
LLERCLDSVPRRDDIQIIVVDDASDPKVVDFDKYRSLADGHVEIIFTTEGLGAGHARNVGLRHAYGQWLMFLDSDDFLLPSALDLIDRYSATQSDIVYFNIESCYSDTRLPAWRHEKFKAAFANYSKENGQLENFLRYGYAEPWGKLIRRSFVEENGFMFQESKVANDYMFSMQTGHAAERIELCLDPLLCVTVRSGSLTSDHFGSDENTMNKLRVFIGVQKFFDENGIRLEPLFRFIRGIRTKKSAMFKTALRECAQNGYPTCIVLFRCLFGYVYSRLKPTNKFC